jgi:hypothetical protein
MRLGRGGAAKQSRLLLDRQSGERSTTQGRARDVRRVVVSGRGVNNLPTDHNRNTGCRSCGHQKEG